MHHGETAMELTNTSLKSSTQPGGGEFVKDHPQSAGAARAGRHPRKAAPVRLPQATAELVERLLTARCGGKA
jgi:hypothetical protein